MKQIDNGTIHYKNEVLRKSIHLCSLSIPVIYYFISRESALSILIPLTIFSLVLDLSRYFFPRLGKVFYVIFGFMLREHEKDTKKKNLNGATYVLLSAFLCVLVFPKIFVVTAFAVLIISDTAAALIGRKFGRHKFLSKSLEGSLAFFITACIVVLIAPKSTGRLSEYIIGIVAVAVGTIAENVSYGYADDNLSIPVSIGLVMWLLYIVYNIPISLSNVPL